MKRSWRLTFFGLLMAASPLVFAAGWVAILKDTPAEQFDDEDLRLFLAAAGTALNAEGPPQTVAWSNPATGSGGHFLELSHSTAAGGTPCKRLKVSTYAKSLSEKSVTYTLCKNATGKWRLTSGK